MLRLRISTQPISMIRSPFRASSPVVSVSRTICLNRDPLVREPVGSLVLGMPRVPLHPVPFDGMARRRLIQRQPQVDVLHRLFVRGLPPAPFPAADPFRDTLHYV